MGMCGRNFHVFRKDFFTFFVFLRGICVSTGNKYGMKEKNKMNKNHYRFLFQEESADIGKQHKTVSLINSLVNERAWMAIACTLWYAAGFTEISLPENMTWVYAAIGVLFVFIGFPVSTACAAWYLHKDIPLKQHMKNAFCAKQYARIITAFTLRTSLITIGYVLLFIPGMIFSTMYRHVPYLLAEYPDKNPLEILAMSRKMSKGGRFFTFVLDFIIGLGNGASAALFGIPGYLSVWPTIDCAGLALYQQLKLEYVNRQDPAMEPVLE